MKLSMDGRVVSLDGVSWEDGLAHRALGVSFPVDPVEPGESWRNPESIAPYRGLVPVEVAIVPKGEARLVSLASEEGNVFADLVYQGSVVAGGEDVPRIEMQGEARWDLILGQLVERSQRLSLSQYNEPFGGLLLIETRRLAQ
jgi:hypothetical protein